MIPLKFQPGALWKEKTGNRVVEIVAGPAIRHGQMHFAIESGGRTRSIGHVTLISKYRFLK